MRILQAANFVAPHSGGIRTMMRHLADGYAAAGHEVVAVVPGERNATRATSYGRIIEIAAPTIPSTGGYRMITKWRTVEDLLAIVAPDRVEVSDRLTLARIGQWAERRKVPSAVFSHERLDALLQFHLGRALPTKQIADHRNRKLAASFDTVVCTTQWAAEEFVRLGVRNLAHVPLGIDLETFHPRRRDLRLRAELARGADVLIVSAVRLSPEKRPDLLVPMVDELVKRGASVRMVVCGDGSVRDMVAEQAEGKPVTMAGFVGDRAHLAAVLASADVVVAPGPYETFGLAALEAMACGTPVVASDRGALPELVVGDSGRTAPSDPAAMAEAVLEIAAAGPGARRAARRRAQDFSWSATVEGMLAVHGLGTGRRAAGRGHDKDQAPRRLSLEATRS